VGQQFRENNIVSRLLGQKNNQIIDAIHIFREYCPDRHSKVFRSDDVGAIFVQFIHVLLVGIDHIYMKSASGHKGPHDRTHSTAAQNCNLFHAIPFILIISAILNVREELQVAQRQRQFTLLNSVDDLDHCIIVGGVNAILIANRAGAPKDYRATLAGRCCESGDLLGENMELQKTRRGDVLAVLVTGAYNYSMASNYNRIPRPPVIMLRDGEARVAVRRESYEDLTRNDL
jgi:hypothetical protein